MMDPIQQFGYTETEAGFLHLVIDLGGYFLRRQFNQFAGCQTGKRTQDFVRKLLMRGHARLTVNRHGRQVIQVHFGRFHVALGSDEGRSRRAHQPSAILSRLMILDFALAHPGWIILAADARKQAYLRDRYGNEVKRLDRLIICSSPDATSTLAFAFLDEGLMTVSAFESWLRRALPLFEAAASIDLIYVAARPFLFAKAEAAFRQIVLGLGTRKQAIDADRLLNYFADRLRLERRETHSWDRAYIDQFRQERNRFSAPVHEALYHLWRGSGGVAVRARIESEANPTLQLSVQFRTYLLEHDYQIFQTIGVPG
jgi:hypothetical protein